MLVGRYWCDALKLTRVKLLGERSTVGSSRGRERRGVTQFLQILFPFFKCGALLGDVFPKIIGSFNPPHGVVDDPLFDLAQDT